jgi:hypothetical protein
MTAPVSARPRTNGLAVASFVLAFCGGGGPLVALPLGIVALVQIRRRGQRGRALAIAGVAISAIVLIAASAWLLAGGPV